MLGNRIYNPYYNILVSIFFSIIPISADLVGRVGWFPKAERVKTLFLSPLQPQNAGGGLGTQLVCYFLSNTYKKKSNCVF